MFGAEKDLDAVRVTIHRGLAGRERCVFGSLTIAIKSRTPSLARSASNSAPNGGAVDPGMTVATRRVRRTLVQRSASLTGTRSTEPSHPKSKLTSMRRPPKRVTTSPLSKSSVGPRMGNATSFTRDLKEERWRAPRSGTYSRANARAAETANTVPMLSALLNDWFTAEGCKKFSVITAATKATMGIAAGIQPRRKASRLSLSNGSEVGCRVVAYPNRSLPRGYTVSLNTQAEFGDGRRWGEFGRLNSG